MSKIRDEIKRIIDKCADEGWPFSNNTYSHNLSNNRVCINSYGVEINEFFIIFSQEEYIYFGKKMCEAREKKRQSDEERGIVLLKALL